MTDIQENKVIPIECITTKQVFPSIKAACKWSGVSRQRIRRVCDGLRGHAGRHPKTGEPLAWRYAR